jgi:hypothetical protein
MRPARRQDSLFFALTACERLPFFSPRPVPFIISFFDAISIAKAQRRHDPCTLIAHDCRFFVH